MKHTIHLSFLFFCKRVYFLVKYLISFCGILYNQMEVNNGDESDSMKKIEKQQLHDLCVCVCVCVCVYIYIYIYIYIYYSVQLNWSRE